MSKQQAAADRQSSSRLPIRIGIAAPYRWDEATVMAITMSELVLRFGYPLSYLALDNQVQDPKTESVHPSWDHKVVDVDKTRFETWAGQMTAIVWLAYDKRRVIRAKAPGRKQIFVPLWHDFVDESEVRDLDLGLFDRVVCPTRACFDFFRYRQAGSNLECLAWDAGWPMGDRQHKPMASGKKRLFVYLDEASLAAIGAPVLDTLRGLLESDSSVQVILNHTSRFSDEQQEMVDAMSRESVGRFLDYPRMCWIERYEAIRASDWTWCPQVRDNASAIPLECLTHGRPVIGFDAAPTGETLVDLYNGRTSRCQRTADPRRVEPDVIAMRRTVFDAVLSPNSFNRISQQQWPDLERRRREFQTRWREILVGRDEEETL